MLAAVTGANGMIGRKIVEQLLNQDYMVRALVRDKRSCKQDIEYVIGDITSDDTIHALLDRVDVVFHCAAELTETDKMHEVNVQATERLALTAVKSGVKCFIYLSSAGVIGPAQSGWITESFIASPGNAYEVSKWQAEQALMQIVRLNNMRICMLRPTNVFDEKKPGILSAMIKPDWRARVGFLIKGGEQAHLVYAGDVAAAALHLAFSDERYSGVYFVGCDEDSRNTVAGLLKMCRQYLSGVHWLDSVYLPSEFSHCLRQLRQGASLHGKVRFSTDKLLNTGFVFPLGLEYAIKKICAERFPVNK